MRLLRMPWHTLIMSWPIMAGRVPKVPPGRACCPSNGAVQGVSAVLPLAASRPSRRPVGRQDLERVLEHPNAPEEGGAADPAGTGQAPGLACRELEESAALALVRASVGQLQAVLDALDTSAQAIEIPAIESRRRYQRRQVMLDGR